MTTVTRPINFALKGRHKRAVLTLSRDPEDISGYHAPRVGGATQASDGRVPRVSKLMALAIRFDGLLRDGVVGSQSELAELAQVSQPRMTQIMNLLHLAPEIQEEILFLGLVRAGSDPITERDMRVVTAELEWDSQRIKWVKIQQGVGESCRSCNRCET